jgi:hypothetical protein
MAVGTAGAARAASIPCARRPSGAARHHGRAVRAGHRARVNWREPMIHIVHNVGDMPLRNFLLEFIPQ